MTKEMNQLTNEEIQQQYCERVQMFFKQVEKWLPNHLGMIESMPGCLVTDATGTYHVEMVGIYEKEAPKPNHFVANILPFGIITLPTEPYINWLKRNKVYRNWFGPNKSAHNLSFGEGILEISSVFSQEVLVYFRKNTYPLIECQSGVFHIFPQPITSDGWYWLGNPISCPLTLVTNQELLQLINYFNDEWLIKNGE